MKAAYSFFFTFCVFFQAALAGVFDQLQFMKIISPTNGQSIEIGTNVTIQYAMQPTVYRKNEKKKKKIATLYAFILKY